MKGRPRNNRKDETVERRVWGGGSIEDTRNNGVGQGRRIMRDSIAPILR